MYYNERKLLFTNLYDVQKMIDSLPDVTTDTLSKDYNGNLKAFSCSSLWT
jgi:hypothetical protein